MRSAWFVVLGADEAPGYSRDEFVTGGARFDVVLDNVGHRCPKEPRGPLVEGGRYVPTSPSTSELQRRTTTT